MRRAYSHEEILCPWLETIGAVSVVNSKIAVAAPGVMSGVLMASVGFVESIIGFTPEQISVLMACYLALDGYGPAANVMGDGAIALICQRLFGESARAKT